MDGQASAEKPAITVNGKLLQIDRLGVTLALRRLGRSDVQNALAYANGPGYGSPGVYERTLVCQSIVKVEGVLKDIDSERVNTAPVSRGPIEQMAPPAVYDALDEDEHAAILKFSVAHLQGAEKKA